MFRWIYISFFQLLLIGNMARGQDSSHAATNNDSASSATPKKQFPYRTTISAAMVAFGAFTATNNTPLENLNIQTMATLGKPAGEDGVFIDNVLPLAPTMALYVLRLNGVPGEHRISETLIINSMAVVIGNGAVMGTKLLAEKMRPDSSNRLSFPSGHTMNAFVSAEIMRRELRSASAWYGVAGYTVAIVTGYLRMYNRKHWLSDVVAGAGMGILSTQLAYVLYEKVHKRPRKQKENLVCFIPYLQQAGAGVYVSVTLN